MALCYHEAMAKTSVHGNPIIDALLRERGVDSVDAAHAFFSGGYEEGLHDPFLLHDMDKAVARIGEAIKNNEHIVVFSDYDCDGIPGGVILHDFFKAIGYENFSSYIPHRHYEGFGFTVAAVEELAKRGAALIITIDCGTTDIEAVAAARTLGIDVIITDHHEPKDVLPDAVALVNPKIGDSYPFLHLCGSGVIFKVVQALLSTGAYDVPPGREKWWLDMVGLATIADMVPLVGENRILARYGLTVLQKSRRPGLRELLRKQHTNQRFLTEDDIGFTIGPRINAASRMDAPEAAFRLLATTDDAEAATTASHLEKLNNERKGAVAAMTREAHSMLHHMSELPAVIVIGNPSWRPSLAGLVANKLAEEHTRPAFVWGRDGGGVLKGSARAGGAGSVIRLMEEGRQIFSEFGGHHASGGFSLFDDMVHQASEVLNVAFHALGEAAFAPQEATPAIELVPAALDTRFVNEILSLAPFGVGNPKPLFRFTNIIPQTIVTFGQGGAHTKMIFETGLGKTDAIAFFVTPERLGVSVDDHTPLTLLAHIERSSFMGRVQTRLRIVAVE